MKQLGTVKPLRRRRRERGVALILVLGSLTIMAIMLSEFQDETAGELSNALSERDALKAEYAAKSAVNLARLLISAEPTIRKSIAPLLMMMGSPSQLPVWEFGDEILGAFGDQDGKAKFQSLVQLDLSQAKNLGLEGAGFEVSIIDEDSKINFNTAARGDAFSQNRAGASILGLIGGAQYDPMFQERDIDDQFTSRQEICSAIVDWADPDSDMYGCDPHSGVASASVPEDGFYQMLPDPYPRKNAAFDSLEELHMIRGIGDDFWSTFVEPTADDPHSRTLTVWGQGTVNVNTANAQTILALICANALEAKLCEDPAQAMGFLSLIELLRSLGRGVPIFSSPKQFVSTMKNLGAENAKGIAGLMAPLLATLNIEPIKFRSDSEMQKSVGTESKVFSIVATGFTKQQKRETRVRAHAVVDFRGAPKPAEAPSLLGEEATAEDSTDKKGKSGAEEVTLPEGASEDAIMGAFRKDPAGKVIYFRLN